MLYKFESYLQGDVREEFISLLIKGTFDLHPLPSQSSKKNAAKRAILLTLYEHSVEKRRLALQDFCDRHGIPNLFPSQRNEVGSSKSSVASTTDNADGSSQVTRLLRGIFAMLFIFIFLKVQAIKTQVPRNRLERLEQLFPCRQKNPMQISICQKKNHVAFCFLDELMRELADEDGSNDIDKIVVGTEDFIELFKGHLLRSTDIWTQLLSMDFPEHWPVSIRRSSFQLVRLKWEAVANMETPMRNKVLNGIWSLVAVHGTLVVVCMYNCINTSKWLGAFARRCDGCFRLEAPYCINLRLLPK